MTVSPVIGWQTDDFGPRKPPLKADGTYGTSYHMGVDIGGPYDAPIVAPEAGYVTVLSSRLRGIYVIVDHGRYRTLHQHLKNATVVTGQWVSEGQQIGVMGTTGGVARHLHTEVHDGTIPIDPEPWYAARGVTLGKEKKPAPVKVLGEQEKKQEGDHLMRTIGHPDRGVWLVGPGYAHHLNGEEWAQIQQYAERPPHTEFPAGAAGARAFDVHKAMYTSNQI